MSYRWKKSQRFQKKVGKKETRHGEHSVSYSPVFVTVAADLEIEIDVDGIAKALGQKAVSSKGKRSAALHGLVRVKVKKEREVGSNEG